MRLGFVPTYFGHTSYVVIFRGVQRDLRFVLVARSGDRATTGHYSSLSTQPSALSTVLKHSALSTQHSEPVKKSSF